MTSPVPVSCAVEGVVDQAVLERLLADEGARAARVYGLNGKRHLLGRLPGYNEAARHSPWVVLVDLDQDNECAPPFRSSLLPVTAEHMCLRIAVRDVEAWLMADVARFAQFLSVSPDRVPIAPESIGNPKATVVEMARRSRRREIREDMVPSAASGREVGPAYSSRLIEFASAEYWRPSVAAERSTSLARCIRDILRLVSDHST